MVILFEAFVEEEGADEEHLQPPSLELRALVGSEAVGLPAFRGVGEAEAFAREFFGVYGPGLRPFELPDQRMGEFLLDMMGKGYDEHTPHVAVFPPSEAEAGEQRGGEDRGEPQIEIVEIRSFAKSLKRGEERPVRYG